MKLQQEGFGPLNILKLCAGGKKKHLISSHKVCPTPLQSANPALILSKTVLVFIWDVFSHSERGRKVHLPWKQRWDGVWWQGSTQAKLFWEGGHGKVGFAGSRATLEVPGWWQVMLSQGRGCSMSRLWCANQAWEPWRRLSRVFGKSVFSRLFFCFGLVRLVLRSSKGKEFLKSKGLLLLRLFWFCSAPLPHPCVPSQDILGMP